MYKAVITVTEAPSENGEVRVYFNIVKEDITPAVKNEKDEIITPEGKSELVVYSNHSVKGLPQDITGLIQEELKTLQQSADELKKYISVGDTITVDI